MSNRNMPGDRSGLSLVEVITAMAVMSLALMGAVTSLLGLAGLDESVRERTVALRAASGRLESVLAYDYGTDVTDLVNWAQSPEERTFAVEGLRSPDPADLDAEITALLPPGPQPPAGVIIVDDADPQRLRFTVVVSWTSREGEARQVRMPTTVTGVMMP